MTIVVAAVASAIAVASLGAATAEATAAFVGDIDAPIFPGNWKTPESVVGGADTGEN